MTVTQVYALVNGATEEAIGDSAVVAEDLSNTVDIGTAIFNANAVDNYVGALVNRIGKTVFVERKYAGRAPKVLMDSWEFGSVLQKIRADLPDADENETWGLVDGQTYEQQVFTKPVITAKYFNSKVTFEIPISICDIQVKESFIDAEHLNAFVSMIFNAVENSMTIKMDALIMRTINNMIGETAYDEVPGGTYTGRTGVKAINLLYEYNQQFGTSLTVGDVLTSPDFLKFAATRCGLTADHMEVASQLFNIGETVKFTPADRRHFVVLADFAKAIGPYSLAPAYHADWLKLPEAEVVPFWQGSGTDFSFGSTSKVDIKTASGHSVTVTGVLAVMFDRDAVAVCNDRRRVTSARNAKGEFTNYWFKAECQNLNDPDENFVYFYVA